MALQLRRGTNKERLQITPAEGELIFVTDWELVQITGTSIDGGSETITFSADHGLAVGDQILYQGTTQLGLTQNTVYYVISPGLTNTACRLATSSGGVAINLTGGTGLTLTFAKTPTDPSGTPIGTNVTALWIGDGSTVGGIPGNTQGLNDLTDVEITSVNEGQTLYYDANALQWKNTSILEVNDTSNRIEVAGDIHATGDLTLNSDLGSNDVNITFTSGRTLKWDHGDQRYEFNTGDLYLTSDLIVGGNDVKASDGNTNITLTSNTLTTFAGDIRVNGNDIQNSSGTTIITFSGNNTILSGDLEVQGQDIKSNGGTTAISLSGANVTVAGDLTVNGTTTTVNSTTLTVDDKNIELASTATPSDTTADGGGITLKGTTDKKIFWDNATDRWYFDNGDGTNYYFLNYIETSPNKGQLIYYNGTEWVNSSLIEFDSITYRPRFQNNNSATAGTIQSALLAVKNTGSSSYTSGDGSGILIGVDDNTNPLTVFAALGAAYNSGGGHQIRLRTSSDNFATDNVVLTVDNDDLKLKGTELVFNAEGTGAAAVDAQITVERGITGADAYLKWEEANDFWRVSNDLFVDGTAIGGTAIATNGNDIYFNYDDGGSGATSSITVRRGANPDAVFRWNETSDRWESTVDNSTYIELPNQGLDTNDSPAFAGVTAGNIRVGVATDNVIDTTTGNLQLTAASTFDVEVQTDFVVDAANGKLYVDYTNSRVGINTLVPAYTLDVNGIINTNNSVQCADVVIDNEATLNTQTTTTTSTATTSISSTLRTTQKVVITITDNVSGEIHALEALAFKKSTTAYLTTYAEIYSNAALATFTADVSGGAIRILATPASTNSTTFTVARVSVD